jgi:hypothetical protein
MNNCIIKGAITEITGCVTWNRKNSQTWSVG